MFLAVCIRIEPYIKDCLCCGNHAILMLYIYLFLEHMTAGLEALLDYITGLRSIPPMGLQIPIQLEYLQNEKDKVFPKVAACFNKLFLPTYHKEDKFFEYFMKALAFGAGFGCG